MKGGVGICHDILKSGFSKVVRSPYIAQNFNGNVDLDTNLPLNYFPLYDSMQFIKAPKKYFYRTKKGENRPIGILQFPNTFARMLPAKKIIDFYQDTEHSQKREEICEQKNILLTIPESQKRTVTDLSTTIAIALKRIQNVDDQIYSLD